MPTLVQQGVVSPTQQRTKPQRKPQKITQLLCLDQNTELKGIFVTWMSECFKYFPNLLSKIYLEIELIINFIEYRLTVSEDHPQVGDYLQNLTYKYFFVYKKRNITKKTKILYLLLDIILPYLKKRLMIFLEARQNENNQQNLNNAENQNRQNSFKIVNFLVKIIRIFDKLYAVANFLNLSIFIYNGQYRSLVQRLLKMQMKFVNPDQSRVLNFTLMNRTMIWQIYQMVLKNVLPFMHKFLGQSLKNIFYLHSYMGVAEQQNTQNCVICGQTPTMVVKGSNCDHVYCFYCTKSWDKKECKKCGSTITQWKPLYN